MGKGKEKEKLIREFSSGGVVYRKNLWLITRSSPSSEYPKAVWRLPKGWVDQGETTEAAAVREVAEESGVKAKIVRKIETVRYFFTTPEKNKVLKFVTFFLMEFSADLPEGFGWETSEIAWLPYQEAFKKLTYAGEKQVLKKANELLKIQDRTDLK